MRAGLGVANIESSRIASGELPNAEFLNFLRTGFKLIADVSIDGSIIFSCFDWVHLQTMLEAGTSIFFELKNICVWVKSNGGMGTFYRSRYEYRNSREHGASFPYVRRCIRLD